MQVIKKKKINFLSIVDEIEEKATYQLKGREFRALITDLTHGLLDHIPASIYWKDTQGKVLGCNQFMLDMLGFKDRAEVIGKNNMQLMPTETALSMSLLEEKVIREGDVFFIEETGTLADQTSKASFLSMKKPFKNAQGNTVGLIGVSFPVSMGQKKKKDLLSLEALKHLEEELNNKKIQKEREKICKKIKEKIELLHLNQEIKAAKILLSKEKTLDLEMASYLEDVLINNNKMKETLEELDELLMKF